MRNIISNSHGGLMSHQSAQRSSVAQ